MTIAFAAYTAQATDAAGRSALRLRAYGYEVPGDAFGRHRTGLKVRGAGINAYAAAAPTVPAQGVAALLLRAAGAGSLSIGADGGASLGLVARGYAADDADAGGRARLGLRPAGAEDPGAVAYAFLVDRAPEVSSYGGTWAESLRSAVAGASGYDALAIARILETARAVSAAGGAAKAEAMMHSAATFESDLAVVFSALLEEGIDFASIASATPQAVVRVVEYLVLRGVSSSMAEAVTAIAAAVSFAATLDSLLLASLQDALECEGSVVGVYTAVVAALDALDLADAAAAASSFLVLMEDQVSAEDAAANAASLTSVLQASIGFATYLALDSGEYLAWVMNAASRGVSTYSSFPFNSFAEIGGVYYGASSAGIFQLDGASDNGVDIRARIRLGMDAMGSSAEKNVPEAVVAYTSDGTLLLRVITTDAHTGQKKAADYKLHPRNAGDLRENRFKPGRGLKAVYWDYELENVDGADFDLAGLELYPVRLSRRTRS
jgi:hypothetical protein